MTLQEQLNESGTAMFERNATNETVNIFTKSNGKGYWLVVVKGSKKDTTDCAALQDVISHLSDGEADSPEWFDL